MKVDSRVVTKNSLCFKYAFTQVKKLHHCLQHNVANSNKKITLDERTTVQLSLLSVQRDSLSSLLDRWYIIDLHFLRLLVVITPQILAFPSNLAQFFHKYIANSCISLKIPMQLESSNFGEPHFYQVRYRYYAHGACPHM